MREGDTASYGHVSLHGYENSLRVCLECLAYRAYENGWDDPVEQWHFEVSGYDRELEEDVVTEEVVVSIIRKDGDGVLHPDEHDVEYNTLIWVAEDDPRQDPISAMTGVEQEDYPWEVNHDEYVTQYSRYDDRETITSAILSLLEEIHLVF